MHPASVRANVAELVEKGLSDSSIASCLALPRTTVRDMRNALTGSRWRTLCPRCWRPGRSLSFTRSDYVELLGLYLGDGCLSKTGRSTRLRLSLDAKYPVILSETETLLKRCFPENSIGTTRADNGATTVLSVYSRHLPCLFPQHGSGKKHERRIALEYWQENHIIATPWPFLRGCIRSDGCTFLNRTGDYSYLTFDFRNSSPDILKLFAWACSLAGLEYRLHRERVRINRRESVEQLVTHVGVKA